MHPAFGRTPGQNKTNKRPIDPKSESSIEHWFRRIWRQMPCCCRPLPSRTLLDNFNLRAMKDLRLEAMGAPLVKHYHDQAEFYLNKMEGAWTPVSRWYWDRRLKGANTMWRKVLQQEINQLRAEHEMQPSLSVTPGPPRRVALDTGLSNLAME